jgi:hypothetical protein
MKVTVNKNGVVSTPVFEPAPGRLEQLIDYYKKAFHGYEIDGYKIENINGIVVAQEGSL